MDSLGETLENIGLSQEIQKGLAANLQKKPGPSRRRRHVKFTLYGQLRHTPQRSQGAYA